MRTQSLGLPKLGLADSQRCAFPEDEARDFARRWKHRGASLIKVYQDLPWPLQRAAAEEARRLGLLVAGHADYLERAVKSVVQGYASLEHTMPPGPYDDVLQMLAQAGTRWVPTLAIRSGNNVRLHEEPERLADGKFLAFTPTWRVRQASRNSTDIRDELPAEWAQQQDRLIWPRVRSPGLKPSVYTRRRTDVEVAIWPFGRYGHEATTA